MTKPYPEQFWYTAGNKSRAVRLRRRGWENDKNANIVLLRGSSRTSVCPQKNDKKQNYKLTRSIMFVVLNKK